jgi:hypothetical protein
VAIPGGAFEIVFLKISSVVVQSCEMTVPNLREPAIKKQVLHDKEVHPTDFAFGLVS